MTTFGIIFFVIAALMVAVYASPAGKTMREAGKETTPIKPVRYPDPTDDRIPF